MPPFVVVQGDRARVRGLNVVGLRRRGVAASRASLRSVAPCVRSGRPALRESRRCESLEAETDPYVRRLVEALREGG